MTYEEYLKGLSGCPFCDKRQQLLAEKPSAFLTYCLAPYAPHHLLVMPKRHVASIHSLTEEEGRDIQELLKQGMSALYKLGHKGNTIFVRDGENTGRSIDHVHYHIVPDAFLSVVGLVDPGRRPLMTQEEIERTMQEVGGAI